MSNVTEYIKTVWEDAPSEETPINAENLNKIENQVESLTNSAIEESLKIKLVYKGEVALLSNLPTTGQKVGDYYIVVEKGVPYLWDGDSFNPQVVIPEVNVSVDSIGDLISSAVSKVTPNDSDTFGYSDAADIDNPNRLKKLSWANFKSALKTYFDTFYATITNLNLKAPIANPIFTGTQTLPNIVTNGIKFPTTQVPSSDPNTLDDCEEGTWTVTDVSGANLSLTQNAQATYTKIGRVVNCTFDITYPTTTNTNFAKMSLPFPFTNRAIGSLGYHTIGQTVTYYCGEIYKVSAEAMKNNELSGKRISCSVTYETN